MPFDLFLALALFATVTAFTPGPNNIMVTASGVNFGFTRTIPHMAGIAVGFLTLLSACATGLGLVFAAFPVLQTVLKIAGALYMLWLAWKVANSRNVDSDAEVPAQPMSFWEAFVFQWVNPKAVVTGLAAIAIYVRPDNRMLDFLILVSVFMLTTVTTVMVWTGFGVVLRGILKTPRHARNFNIAMALLLVVSIVPMVL
jgi:threonine/homoserine/homoserine lactone efflux protein